MRIIPVPLPRRSLVSGLYPGSRILLLATPSRGFPQWLRLCAFNATPLVGYNPRSQWRDRCGFTPHSLPRKLGYHLSSITGGRDCQGGHSLLSTQSSRKPSLVVLQDIKEGDSPVRAGKVDE